MRACWILAAIVVMASAAACTKHNPAYCDDSTPCAGGATCTNHMCPPPPDAAAPDASLSCTTSAMCADPTKGVCNASGMCVACTGSPECAARGDALSVCEMGTCVECAVSNDCPAAAPICDMAAHTCGPCTSDLECAGRTDSADVAMCEADGTCPTPATVLIADPMSATCGSGEDGSPANPYCAIQSAVDAVAASGKHKIKLRPGSYLPFDVSGGTVVTIFGPPDAVVDQGSSGQTRVTVTDPGTDVTLRGFRVAQATSSYGVFCQNGATCRLERMQVDHNSKGVAASDSPLLSITRTMIDHNAAGGVLTDVTDFVMENDILFNNGGASSTVGAASLGSINTPTGPRTFQFNTVYYNHAMTVSGGIQCASATHVGSSIIWMNTPFDVSMTGCNVFASDIDQAVVSSMNGNTGMDPSFVLPDTFGPDLHLMPGSPCVNLGETTAPPMVDYFGQHRDSMPDMGADELGMP